MTGLTVVLGIPFIHISLRLNYNVSGLCSCAFDFKFEALSSSAKMKEADVTPWRSCVVRAGILLTREPLQRVFKGFGGGVGCREDKQDKQRREAHAGPKYKLVLVGGDLRMF